jgi:predicted nucleotidyltransferase
MENTHKEVIERYKRLIKKAVKKVFSKDILVILFGSLARGEFDRQSDIDIGIYIGAEISGKKYLEISAQLERLPILREIDLVDLAKVKDASFLEQIIKEGTIWISSERLLKDLKRRLESMKKS